MWNALDEQAEVVGPALFYMLFATVFHAAGGMWGDLTGGARLCIQEIHLRWLQSKGSVEGNSHPIQKTGLKLSDFPGKQHVLSES